VDVIITRHGTPDKYIGDAIMALFGAPVKHDDDAWQSVMAGLDMLDALGRFNAEQAERDGPPFRIGIGINYGEVTVGNIGYEKKMDYTVIGDMVNLASRLEGLTKIYHEPLIISESMHQSVGTRIPCRMLDRVAVKGKTEGVRIYGVRRELGPAEREGWELHEQGIAFYYGREFEKALDCFDTVQQFLPGDAACARFAQRCRTHIGNPPGPAWDGVEVITEK
jgi:class 3 adenylate cyclase